MTSPHIFADTVPLHRSQDLPGAPRLPLVGRQPDVDAVRDLLGTGVPVLLVGLPGVGKTALIHALAQDYVEQPGGVLWLENADETALALANRVARAYGAPTSATRDDDEAFAFFRQVHDVLLRERPLVVLDGRVRPEAAREFVRACAPGIPVLLAATRPAAGPWTPYEVAPLGQAQSVVLLQGVIQDETQTSDALAPLAQTLDGNALSLTVAGLQLAAGHTPQEFLHQIPTLPPGPSNRVMAALMAAYRLLPQELQGMVMLIGTAFASGASEELLADVTGAPPEGLSARMRQLVARGFADERVAYDQPYFVAHEMVQRFAQAFLRGKHRLDTMRARHLHAVPVFVRRHIDEPSPEHYRRLAVEMPTVMAAARYAVTQGKTDYLRELTEMLAPTSESSFVQAAGYSPEYQWLCHLLEVPAADKLGVLGWMTVPQTESAPEPAETPVATPPEAVSGSAEATSSTSTEAVAQPSAEVTAEAEPSAPPASPTPAEEPETSEQTVSPENSSIPLHTEPSVELPDSAEALERLGQTAREQDPQQLIARYAQAAQSFRADGKVEDELAALEALAMLSLEGERYEDVLAYVDQGMKLAQEADNPQREGELLVVLGDLQVTLERWDGAESAYKQAIAAFRPVEAWLNIGLALDKLGSVYWETGRSQEAADTWEQAVPVFERLGRNDLLREVLSKIADTRAELLQWDSARAAGERLLALARAEGDRAAECEQLLWLGSLSESQGNREGAQQYYRAALHVALGLGEAEWQGQSLLALARLLIDETVHLNRTLQLLEAAERLLPDDTEVQRLLKRAKTRQERLIRGGVTLPVASSSLQDYARQAYEALSLPDGP
ncbi:MAG: hypothetical protein Kow00106_23450 [Anaerolineae bacterium]